MPDVQVIATGSRSDQRIPKMRTRGRANRKKLLATAQKLFANGGDQTVRFSDVFETAGISRGSAYRIYNDIEDLMQDLASSWIHDFVVFVNEEQPRAQPTSWVDLSDHLLVRAAAYWDATSDMMRVLPRVRSNAPDSYRAAVRDLTNTVADTFERYFVMPDVADWHAVLVMFTSLCDLIFTDAVRREGTISEQRLGDAQKICATYLSLYLPDQLPAKDKIA